MIKLFLLTLFAGCSILTYAQEKQIRGKVLKSDGMAISGATLLLYQFNDNKLLNYAVADLKGEFNISVTGKTDKVVLEISMLGYHTRIDTITLSGNITVYSTHLEEKAVELETVVIKASKIEDTVRLLTDRMVLNERSTLKEILDQSDGFIISEDGSIAYRGRQITKILINNKEVFINQNKVALDNLNYGIMDNLELINNYRDKFDLDFSNFKESIININTKKEFKGVLKFTGEIAAGFKDNYQARSKTFYFSDQLNSFLTNSINNTGNKDFSFKDMPAAFKEPSSGWFKKNSSFFFQSNDLVKKAFDLNNSFTIRKEGNRYRLGTILYHTQSSQDIETGLLSYTSMNDEKVKEEASVVSQKGKMIAGNIQWSYLISKKTALNFDGTLGHSIHNNRANVDIQNYFPTSDFIRENKSEKTKTTILDGNLNLKTMLNSSIRSTTGISYFNENTTPNIRIVFSPPADTLLQSFSFTINHLKMYSELEKRFNSLFTAGMGISAKHMNESLKADFKQTHKREVIVWEPSLMVRGRRNHWEYNVRVIPQIYNFQLSRNINNRKRPEISSSLHFIPNGNNDVWVSYSQKNYMPELYNDLDTLAMSFNNRLVNKLPIYNTVSSTSNWQAGYYYSNLTKLNNLGISYSGGVNYDNLEAVFESVENNVFYYRNLFIPKRRWQQADLNIGKGFYFTEKYHKIHFSTTSVFSQSKFQTMIGNSFVDFENQNQQYTCNIRFEPQEWPISRLAFTTRWRTEKLFLEKENINTQESFRFSVELSRKQDKFDFDLSAGFTNLKNRDTDFTAPFFNFKTTVQLKGPWQVYLQGKNLLHLFDIAGTEFTGLSIRSEGNFVHQQINRYNMRFLMAGLIYKP